MTRLPIFFIAALLLVSAGAKSAEAGAHEAPKHEFRGVWVATVYSGLDWGGSGWPPPEERMENILNRAERLGLNAIVLQVIGRGDAMYQSERLPWAYNLTGEPGEDPGWDPLQKWIDAAHERGMELHAWVNIFNVAYGNDNDSQKEDLPHVRHSNPEWIEDDVWLNPGIPEAREWMVGNIVELVENYDIDAIHYDYIRYNQGGYTSDSETMSEHNPDDISGLDNWRRHNINEFAKEVHEEVSRIKPWMKIGAAPVGHYDRGSADGWGALWGYSSVYQDSRHWAEEGHIDYIAPQIYWTIGDAPRFEFIVSDWVQNRKNDRHLYIGTNPASSDVRREIHRQIDTTRTRGAEGQMFFRYQSISADWDIFTSGGYDRYGTEAIVPPMPWHDMDAPNRARNFVVNPGHYSAELEWDEPDPAGKDHARFRYAVYRTETNDRRTVEDILADPSLIRIVTGKTSFTDELSEEDAGKEYRYFVTALSRNNVESAPGEDQLVITSSDEEPLVSREFELKQNFPNPFNPTTTISFRMPEHAHAQLVVYDLLGREVATLVDESLQAGTHNVQFDARNLASGVYIYRLTAGNYSETRKMIFNK